ncbi:hypothetical protein IPG41_07000 [Candidatus Peregrinibacteria bacterium]|nr:MAG: hypothetical protein IPG41_07000 [Candidatus Peregrinibacteria bacterium]
MCEDCFGLKRSGLSPKNIYGMDVILQILNVLGYVSTAIVIVTVIYRAVLWCKGVKPAFIRFGNAMGKRKISIFASHANIGSLKSLLVDTTLIKEKNIIEITHPGDIGRGQGSTLYVVDFRDWQAADFQRILDQQRDKDALVVYAPTEGGQRIPDAMWDAINRKRNVTVTNMRGRLLNDVIVSMITTSYE